MTRILVILGALTLAGCASAVGQTAGTTATAALAGPGGQKVGTATLTEAGGKVTIVVEASGLTPGKHGIHIHAVGKCDPPDFTTAGAHFNPGSRKHGLETPEGAHAGDLPNLVADAGGRARYEAVAQGITLRDGPTSLFDADASAIVIHEKEDDQKTDPTGNSGGRVACGVLGRR